MLDLQQTYSGHPSAGLQHLTLTHDTFILYPSAGSVIVLNARTLSLVRVLAFSEAFPGSVHANDKVICISVDSGMKLIVAAMSTRIAAWSLSGVRQDTWRVHSTLRLPGSHSVATLDNKSGLLAIGTDRCLSVYTLILENDLPTWSQKWTVPAIALNLVRFAPSLMYIAATSRGDNAVRLHSTTSGRQTQVIPHPRPVINLSWRHSQASSRDDLILYTITNDSTLRIFLPVLDSPQNLQLHAALDLFSSLPFSVATKYSKTLDSSVFWLDRDVVDNVLNNILKGHPEQEDARSRRIREIREEGWDLFLRVLGDGSIVISAIANIDRRPPTLLKQFTLQQSPPSTLPNLPSHLYFLPNPQHCCISLIISSPLATFDLFPLPFLDAHSDGMHLSARAMERAPHEDSEVVRLVRTPDGRGVGVIRANGGGEAWRVVDMGKRLVLSGSWSSAEQVVVLNHGRTFATYSAADSLLTLHSSPPISVPLAKIDSLFTMPSNDDYECIIGITPDFSVIQIRTSNAPSLIFHSQNHLPLPCPPKMILPVDPMAWGLKSSRAVHDILLSVSALGELAFWVPDENTSPSWKCTGKVRTGRTGITNARCSSAKKTALIVLGVNGEEELTIWDSQESEFASGLEYRGFFSERIHDLDWTSTPDMQSILAVGFAHHVDLLCQQRMTYFDEGPGWALCWKVDIGNFIPCAIGDSIWLANGSLLIAAGHQMCLYGEPTPSAENPSSENLFGYVARQNGPLEDHHPQMLLQCLLWEKVELVKDIIMNLARDVERSAGEKGDRNFLPIENFLRKDQIAKPADGHKKQYGSLFDVVEQKDEPEEEGFSRPLATRLIQSLEAQPLPHLTHNEQAHLLVLIQTTLEIDEQRRALDANGLRYLISMRSFYILNHRASAPGSPQSNGVAPRQTGRRERLRYRDMIWAFHCESQDLLLQASTSACNGKMGWSDARALGVGIWLNSLETLRSQMEVIARNEYMSGDNRDPTSCSLYYFALGKTKLVHGLWRQAAWHKEQTVMLKFLSNDFTDARWRTAALKNAYALLSKRRFEYAAAFFLLGGSLKDAINVCIKQLGDFQLAIALARVVEQSNEGPILLDILRSTVLPLAFKDGNRWLGSWAFWTLHRRDLAVRILLTPLQDIADAFGIPVTEIGEPHYDDPSLALLFSQLRSKTLQAAKGTSEISGRAEFNFVLQMARVFCRMGCHVLALDLVRSWSFDRPSVAVHESSPLPNRQGRPSRTPSPTISRRSLFSLEPALRRRSSIMIDMDIPSLPPTRSASPERPTELKTTLEEPIKEENDLFARKAGLGSLMKSAKQDIKVPEFDMSAFF